MSRGYVWIDETIEHSEQDSDRAALLAKKWSALHSRQENIRFEAEYRAERFEDYEPEPCETCGGDCFLGMDGTRNRHGELVDRPCWVVGIACPNPDCSDGLDLGPINKARSARATAEAELDLEIELVNDKLALIGARMMRSYEHWGEEEQRIAYMEGEYSY